MSTQSTVRHGDGFILYTDFFDGDDVVHLRLDNVEFTASSGGLMVLRLERALAEKLGLVPAWEAPDA